MITRSSTANHEKAAHNPYEIHVNESFPDPYPRYPGLITRIIHPPEAHIIDLKYGVSRIPATGLDSKGYPLDYDTLAERTSKFGLKCLNSHEEAFVQFVNVLYLFCFDKYLRGEDVEFTWKVRRVRGSLVRNTKDNPFRPQILDQGQVDEILESALQRSDFEAIRAILNYEGYGISVNEPNDLVIPEEWDKKSELFHNIEIQISPEEYETWNAPLEACDIEPTEEELGIQRAFAKAIAENIPPRLERLIRLRDVGTLRMMLRLYGHDILPNQPGDDEDLSDDPPSQD